MRGPTPAEVHLKREELPSTCVVSSGREVDADMPDDASTREEPAHSQRVAGQVRGIGGISGEAAADIDLASVTAQDLFVCGEHSHLSERRELHLDTWAGELDPRHALLHNGTRGEIVQVPLG